MKKYITIALTIILIYFLYNFATYRLGWYINLDKESVESNVKIDKKDILLNGSKFEIKGINMASTIPGSLVTDYFIDKETYLRWFKYIDEMGANTIKVYNIMNQDFYDAFYEYNKENNNPLYLLQGITVDDYGQFSNRDMYSDEVLGKLLEDTRTAIDIVHGRMKFYLGEKTGNGTFNKDISEWLLGYMIGSEWQDDTIEYTNHINADKSKYEGEYIYTKENATPFEAMLAEIADRMMEYETNKYNSQKLITFSNSAITDPFDYSEDIEKYFKKISKIDVEHIGTTEKVKSGIFASYNIYTYYPDFFRYDDNENRKVDDRGKINTYYTYIKKVNDYHSIPVVISEFGVPSSRGISQVDKITERHQGALSEEQQGNAIVRSYKDIKNAGCSGAILYEWQDEWCKKVWNTEENVDLKKTPFWSDYQTSTQSFGLLAFDPGEEKSICYVDGDVSEWQEEDVVSQNYNMQISMKYDEKFIYFMVNKEKFDIQDKLYIPIDTIQTIGSNYCKNKEIKFERNADFIICIDGKENSRILVQDRYDNLIANHSYEINNKNAYVNFPEKNSTNYNNIRTLLNAYGKLTLPYVNKEAETYETGKLTYGNANPESEDFNSLADFCINGDYIEIKVPWQIFNFSNPSEMMIHDDYYENYGVKEIQIDKIYVGIGSEETKQNRIPMQEKELKGWGKEITYHERLKKSYYKVKRMWTEE